MTAVRAFVEQKMWNEGRESDDQADPEQGFSEEGRGKHYKKSGDENDVAKTLGFFRFHKNSSFSSGVL